VLGKLRRRGSAGSDRRRLKILFATDLHGSEYTFRKLLTGLELWRPDVFVGGGDVAGKGMLPLVHEGGGRYRGRWMGREQVLEGAPLTRLEEQAAQAGFYPARLEADEVAALRKDDGRAEALFEQLMRERWADWLHRLEARCAALAVRGYVIAGNDDPWSLDELTSAPREWVTGADGAVVDLGGGLGLLSCGLANQTPWGCPRDVPENTLGARLEELAEQARDYAGVIGNIHVPPHGSSLDIAPTLDTSVSPPRAIAGQNGPVGSTAVRDFIERHQPRLTLHGHIHESPGAVTLGQTLAINPGSEYAEGVLRAVLVTVTPDRVLGHQFVTG
jgi:Icc-related predicted phosphoesterase